MPSRSCRITGTPWLVFQTHSLSRGSCSAFTAPSQSPSSSCTAGTVRCSERRLRLSSHQMPRKLDCNTCCRKAQRKASSPVLSTGQAHTPHEHSAVWRSSAASGATVRANTDCSSGVGSAAGERHPTLRSSRPIRFDSLRSRVGNDTPSMSDMRAPSKSYAQSNAVRREPTCVRWGPRESLPRSQLSSRALQSGMVLRAFTPRMVMSETYSWRPKLASPRSIVRRRAHCANHVEPSCPRGASLRRRYFRKLLACFSKGH